jgi:hypothetical protein
VVGDKADSNRLGHSSCGQDIELLGIGATNGAGRWGPTIGARRQTSRIPEAKRTGQLPSESVFIDLPAILCRQRARALLRVTPATQGAVPTIRPEGATAAPPPSIGINRGALFPAIHSECDGPQSTLGNEMSGIS